MSISVSSPRQLPWTRSCFVCGENNPHGLQLRSWLDNDGRVVLEHLARAADLGYRNIVHGGISATLIDEVMTWAAIVALRRPCVAAEMSFRLKHPITVGTKLLVTGWITENRRRILLTEGDIRDETGRVLVSATGKYVAMSSDGAQLCEKDFVDSPDVIPPQMLFNGDEALIQEEIQT